ncbi:MAG: MFS transporter [Anaerolineae bacterium]|nr:MFS transporter [Anaerolineae bacterium]
MFALYSRKWDARRVYLLISGATAFFFNLVFTVNMVYQVQTVGLSPLQLVLVGTTLELAIFFFEVPTGVVADVYSRRLSIIIGFALIGLGFCVEGLFPSFIAILAAQVLWGIGYTFTSGAQQAWITDEVGEGQIGPIFIRASQIGNLIGIPSTLFALLLGSLLLNLPIVLGGLLFIALAAFLVLVMPEHGFKAKPAAERESTWREMSTTLRAGLREVRGQPVLLALLGIGLFVGLYSEGFDRLNTAHLLESFTLPQIAGVQPVALIGIIGMVGGLIAIVVMRVVEKRLNMRDGRALARVVYLCNALLVGAIIGFALAGSFVVAVLLRWLVTILRTVIDPLQSTWMNQHIDSSVRATVISMTGQVDAFGQIAGGPPVGLLGDRFGIRAALVASGLILSPVLLLYARVLRSEHLIVSEPAPE